MMRVIPKRVAVALLMGVVAGPVVVPPTPYPGQERVGIVLELDAPAPPDPGIQAP